MNVCKNNQTEAGFQTEASFDASQYSFAIMFRSELLSQIKGTVLQFLDDGYQSIFGPSNDPEKIGVVNMGNLFPELAFYYSRGASVGGSQLQGTLCQYVPRQHVSSDNKPNKSNIFYCDDLQLGSLLDSFSDAFLHTFATSPASQMMQDSVFWNKMMAIINSTSNQPRFSFMSYTSSEADMLNQVSLVEMKNDIVSHLLPLITPEESHTIISWANDILENACIEDPTRFSCMLILPGRPKWSSNKSTTTGTMPITVVVVSICVSVVYPLGRATSTEPWAGENHIHRFGFSVCPLNLNAELTCDIRDRIAGIEKQT